jgi:hypothetical protein
VLSTMGDRGELFGEEEAPAGLVGQGVVQIFRD